MKHAAVLGAGAWGTALAKVLTDKGERVTLFTRRPELPRQIAETRVNERYLPGVELSGDLEVTTDLGQALAEATLIVLAVPSHALREVVGEAHRTWPVDSPIVSASGATASHDSARNARTRCVLTELSVANPMRRPFSALQSEMPGATMNR